MIEQPPAFDIHNIKDIINLLNDCRFPPIIERINNECLYWDKVKHLEIPKGITHEKLWKLIKLRRSFISIPFVFQEYKISLLYYQCDTREAALFRYELRGNARSEFSDTRRRQTPLFGQFSNGRSHRLQSDGGSFHYA